MRLAKQSQERPPTQESRNALGLPMQFLTEGVAGFRPTFEGSHLGSPFELGIEWQKGFGARNTEAGPRTPLDLTVHAEVGNTGYALLLARVDFPHLLGSPFGAAIDGEYSRDPREQFFGLGEFSILEDRSLYQLRRQRVGGSLWWNPAAELRIGGGLHYLQLDQRPASTPETPSIDEIFGPLGVPGLNQELPYLQLGAFVEMDSRDLPNYPRSGGYYAVVVQEYDDQDLGRYDFRGYTVDLRHYFPFVHGNRVLALRFLGEATDPAERDGVPFHLQPALGGAYDLRSLSSFRYRDLHKILMQAEYRWAAWIGLDMALFVDAGNVFRGSPFALDRLRTAYGLGFRLHTETSMMLRLDLAFGEQGFKPQASFTHVF
jgi:hypothetical protein